MSSKESYGLGGGKFVDAGYGAEFSVKAEFLAPERFLVRCMIFFLVWFLWI